MKNLVLAAIFALALVGCATNESAPAPQNAQEYRHAQIDKSGCPHNGMKVGQCVDEKGAAGCNGGGMGANCREQCVQGGMKADGCAHGEGGAKGCGEAKEQTCPHHRR